jgi:hypothetical protein
MGRNQKELRSHNHSTFNRTVGNGQRSKAEHPNDRGIDYILVRRMEIVE